MQVAQSSKKQKEIYNTYCISSMKRYKTFKNLKQKELKMTEICLTDLGYFTQSRAEKIKQKLQDKSFYHFKVDYSNFAGNCTLIVRTDRAETNEQELKEMFLHCCLNEID